MSDVPSFLCALEGRETKHIIRGAPKRGVGQTKGKRRGAKRIFTSNVIQPLHINMYDFSYLECCGCGGCGGSSGVAPPLPSPANTESPTSEAGARAATTISANVTGYHLALAKC